MGMTYRCSTFLTWALVVSIGLLAMASTFAVFFPPDWLDRKVLRAVCTTAFAAAFGLSVAALVLSAQHMAVGLEMRRPQLWLPAAILTVGLTGFSGVSVDLGFQLLSQPDGARLDLPDSHIIAALGVMLALAKPAMGYIVQQRIAADRVETAAAEAEIMERAASREARLVAAELKRRSFRSVAKGSLIAPAAAVALGLAGQGVPQAIRTAPENMPAQAQAQAGANDIAPRSSLVAQRHKLEDEFQYVRRLYLAGHPGAEIVRQTAFKRSTVYGWISQLNRQSA